MSTPRPMNLERGSLGLALEQGQDGRFTVEQIVPGGAADKSGQVSFTASPARQPCPLGRCSLQRPPRLACKEGCSTGPPGRQLTTGPRCTVQVHCGDALLAIESLSTEGLSMAQVLARIAGQEVLPPPIFFDCAAPLISRCQLSNSSRHFSVHPWSQRTHTQPCTIDLKRARGISNDHPEFKHVYRFKHLNPSSSRRSRRARSHLNLHPLPAPPWGRS
jgi:hypothetical protein